MLDHQNLVAISFQWGKLISQKPNADSGLLDNKKAWTSIAKRPRRSAVLLLCTSSWSIPRSPVAQNLRKTFILKALGCQRLLSRQVSYSSVCYADSERAKIRLLMERLILFDIDGTLTRTQSGYIPFNEA